MKLDGFVDVSLALKCGIYALVSQGEVVYVGQSKCMLTRIYSHRNAKRKSGSLPSWFPVKGIAFDEIHVQPCHPDLIDQLERDMINRYKPKFNTLLKSSRPVSTPFNVTIGDHVIAVNAGSHPTLPKIERRL